MNGWITTIYDDSAATGTFVRTGGTVPPILTQDSQKTNTEAVEWIKFTSNGTVYYKNVQEIYDGIKGSFGEAAGQ